MSPFLYSLCQKPIVGVAMAAAALCEFPPLVKDIPLRIDAAGAVVTADVNVPVDLNYALLLELSHAGGESLSKQEVGILGDRRLEECEKTVDPASLPRQERAALGRPMPFRVEVRRKPDNMLVYARQVTTMCVAAKWANQRTRSLGEFSLQRGDYSLRIENVAAQSGLERLSANLVLAPVRASAD